MVKFLVRTGGFQTASDQGFLPIEVDHYFMLLDWTGREPCADKWGAIPEHVAPIVKQLGLHQSNWVETVRVGPGKESAPFLRIWGALLDRSLIRSSLSEAHFKSRLVVCFVRRERLGW
jgi:hypothetical protein